MINKENGSFYGNGLIAALSLLWCVIGGVVFMSNAYAQEQTGFLNQTLSRTFSKTINQIAWSPDQTKIAATGKAMLYLWDVKNDEEVWSLMATDPRPGGLAFSPDSQNVVVPPRRNDALAITDQPLLALHPITNAEHPRYLYEYSYTDNGPLHFQAQNFSESADGSVLIVTPSGSKKLVVYDPKTWQVTGHVGDLICPPLGRPSPPEKIAVDSKNQLVAAAGYFTGMRIWDYKNNKEIIVFRASNTNVSSMAFNPVSGELVTGGDGVIEGAIVHGDGAVDTGASQDDPKAILKAWNPRTGQMLRSYEGTRWGIGSLSVSPDGKYVAATEGGPLVGVWLHIWNAADGKLLDTIAYGREDGSHYFVSFSPDSQRLAVAIGDKVHIYDLDTGKH